MLHRFQRRHAQRFQRLKLGFEHRILFDAVGMKLLIDPFLQPDLLHALDIAGPGTEGQAIQRVQDLIVFPELFLEQLVVARRRSSAGLGADAAAETDKHHSAADGKSQESTRRFS